MLLAYNLCTNNRLWVVYSVCNICLRSKRHCWLEHEKGALPTQYIEKYVHYLGKHHHFLDKV